MQVPKGWDKLYVSIVSTETGKTLTKSGKASVRNASCQWTETLSESIWISRHDSSKQIGDCFFKLVVSMGSARSSILGEATVNLASYKNSKTAVPVSLSLKKCNHGTILQVSHQSNSHMEDVNVDCDDVESKSDVSDNSLTKSIGSSSSSHLDSSSHAGELLNRDFSFSASGSRYSFDSTDGSLGRETYSPLNNLTGIMNNQIGRQDSTGSQNSSHGSYSFNDSSRSNQSSFNSKVLASRSSLQIQRDEFNQVSRSVASSPLRNAGSSKDLLEAAEAKIEELRAEARMWEQNARKLMNDLEKLRKELSDQSKCQASLEMELSESRRECDGLKQEIEQVKILLEESLVKQKSAENMELQAKDMGNLQKELEDEVRFEKESNANLALQLKKTQESNIELVSILQELEDTIEKLKMEIANLSKEKVQELEAAEVLKTQTLMECEAQWRDKLAVKEEEIINLKSKLSEALKVDNFENGADKNLIKEVEVLKQKIEELEKDCNELTDENLELLLKLKESEKDLPICGASSNHLSNEYEENSSLSISESEVSKMISLKGMLEEELNKKEMFIEQLSTDHLKIQCTDLEKKCADLELHLQDFKDKTSYLDGELSIYHARAEEQGIEITALRQQLESFQGKETETKSHLTDNFKDIMISHKEILENKFEIDKHKSDNLLKEQEVEALRCCQRQLETQISILQNEKRRLEENMEVVQKRGMMSSSCLDDSNNEIMMFNSSRMMSTGLDASQNQILVLNSSKDSHVSTSEIPTRMSELESSKSEMEIHLAELEKENIELSERICGLEAQLRYLTDERESSRLELQNSESCALNLQNEMRRLESEWETDKGDRKQKLQEMQNMWLEAQSENEYLKIANLKLQTTAESLIDECSLLQKSLLELRKQKIELHEHCTILEAELRESQKGFSDMLKEVEALERKYILILEEIASKEKALALEVDVLLQDNKQYKEKLEEETSLNQIYLEKAVEVENLQKEVAHITEHMSTTCDEKERTAAAAVVEVSRLRADRATLEASLHTVRGKLRLSESNLSTLQMESETKLLGLQNELAASRQNQEILMADNEKLLELLEDVKSNEDKYKSIVRGLELKLKATAYEGLQLKEEICSLRVQLQKTALLEDEILALKKSLNEVQFENQRLEVSLQMLSGDYEELMAAKMQLLQMISDMQKAVAELEHCRRSKVSLEEKILRLEGDLTAREALGGQDAELKNELARVKRANNELHRKIRHLQEENQEYIQRTQTCEGELEQRIEAKQISENSRIEYLSKLQLLETKLAEALEANDMYKVQLKSFLLEECSNHSNKAGKEFEGSASTLEIELRDLQERYFHMSLKCAEVESEREQLVLKLRTVSNGRS
ncbi:DNA repair protein RAD50, putative [Ricinus communis]|uniref:DNA repair protein RAD50, putative n=1 Tax=Ricinus communis TaxID=3988 RepID=B9T762_RICCO|nr:DNA repair protein RAD50, putative [Ricinus communis]